VRSVEAPAECMGISKRMPVQTASAALRHELPTVSVVVPVHNSAATLAELVERTRSVLDRIARRHEIILVNDGSRDDSWPAICELATGRPGLRGIDLVRNYGQQKALLAGIRVARYEVIITMDDDLQHPPEEITKLLAELSDSYDVVYGTFQQRQHGFWRDTLAHIARITIGTAMGIEHARDISAFRAFRRPLRETFGDYRSPCVAIDVLLDRATTRFTATTVHHDRRTYGRSGYSLCQLLGVALSFILACSSLPVRPLARRPLYAVRDQVGVAD
jgi:glycosyltransferase involved in cell wall biosynthesis